VGGSLGEVCGCSHAHADKYVHTCIYLTHVFMHVYTSRRQFDRLALGTQCVSVSVQVVVSMTVTGREVWGACWVAFVCFLGAYGMGVNGCGLCLSFLLAFFLAFFLSFFGRFVGTGAKN